MKMFVTKCPICGGAVLKPAGKLKAFSYDECLDCRRKREAEGAEKPLGGLQK